MKVNKLSIRLIKYEIINASSNIITIIFGVCFPLFMSMLFSFIFSSDVEKSAIPELNAGLFITMIMIIPLATMFIGHASNFSQEVESGSHQRFKLFGYNEATLLMAKLVANLVFLTGAIVVYSAAMFIILDIAPPAASAFIVLILFMYLIASALLFLSHAIALLLRRFSTTFGITMALYFTFMTLSGMMGVSPDKFPIFLRTLAKGLPMYYISTDFYSFWMGETFNFLPLCVSLLALTAFSLGLTAVAVRLNKKHGKDNPKPKAVYWD